MENLAFDETCDAAADYLAANDDPDRGACGISLHPGASLPADFVSEIDAWARHAMAANGFGGF